MATWNLDNLANQAQNRPIQFQNRLGGGLELWDVQQLPPGDNTHIHLQCCLQASGNYQGKLVRFFAANLLLFDANEECWQLLTQYLPELPMLRTYQWVLCPILCTGKEKNNDKIIHVLCGWSRDAKAYSYPCITNCAESKEALEMAFVLAAKYADSTTQHFSIFPIFQEHTIAGGSFGLPLFLALCAAQRHSSHITYATGKLAKNGDIQAVGNIDRKTALCKKKPLIVPASNNVEDMQTTFAVNTIYDALELNYAKNIRDIREIQKDIHKPERFLANLVNYSTESLEYMQNSICSTSLNDKWYSEAVLKNLEAMLTNWSKATEACPQKDANLSELLCLLYPWEQIKTKKQNTSEAMWHLVMRHMRKCNHEGNYKTASEIWEFSKKLYEQVSGMKRYEEFIIAFSLMLTMHHNRFDFTFDPTQVLPQGFQNRIELYWEDVKNDGVDSKALVNYFGTLGQHAAFCQKTNDALKYFEKSEKSIHPNHTKDICQNHIYKFFTFQDMWPSQKDATLMLNKLCHHENIADILLDIKNYTNNPFLVHAIVRYIADMPREKFFKLKSSCICLKNLEILAENNDKKHPWPLIIYNIGRVFALHKQEQIAEKILQKNITMFFYKSSSPILKTMSLLPLHQLWNIKKMPSSAEDIFSEIKICISNELHLKHFESLLYCKTIQYAMEVLDSNIKHIFPFNYR